LRPVFGAVVVVALNPLAPLILRAIEPSFKGAKHPTGVKGLKLARYILGALESLLFFGSFWATRYELAAGWLVFKLGTKWSGWQHIVRVSGLDSTWMQRNEWATRVAHRFLVGTACNIVFALIAAFIARHFC
jgi:hypothetical protein